MTELVPAMYVLRAALKTVRLAGLTFISVLI